MVYGSALIFYLGLRVGGVRSGSARLLVLVRSILFGVVQDGVSLRVRRGDDGRLVSLWV
jgi:hypothetical protein